MAYKESLTTIKENQYIFVGPEDANKTEKIVESILARYENVLFLFMDYDKLQGTLCDGQKIDKQKYFPHEACLYNLKQLILPESVSSNGAAWHGPFIKAH